MATTDPVPQPLAGPPMPGPPEAESARRSVTGWIAALKEGRHAAAYDLWQRYFERVVLLARRKLGAAPRRVADEEDIAVSVFRRLCEGAANGRFPELGDRDELWRLLTVLTMHRVADQKRQNLGKKRGGGTVRGDSAFDQIDGGLDQFLSRQPTPEFLAMMDEEHERLMSLLDDEPLRRVAEWKFDGYTNGEIARKLNLAVRSVERKLERIRARWLRVERVES